LVHDAKGELIANTVWRDVAIAHSDTCCLAKEATLGTAPI